MSETPKVWVVVADYGTAHEAEPSVWGVYGSPGKAQAAAESLRGTDVYAADVEEHDVL